MKQIKKTKDIRDLGFSLPIQYFPENAILLDIETTGLSPNSHSIYLIGAAFRTGHKLITEQYFASNRSEEAEILDLFVNIFQRFETCISFNGSGFDLPFLKKRMQSYQKILVDNSKNYVDLFELLKSLKFIFHFENYKQKTLETFLGIDRQDKYTGKDLIQIYKKNEKEPDPEAEHLLFLHNYEDLLGMAGLLELYPYLSFANGGFEIEKDQIHDHIDFQGRDVRELVLDGKLKERVIRPLPLAFGIFSCYIKDQTVRFQVPLCQEELKYYYPDYKNYYYLPLEDQAIHKSLARFVDKDHREKAKKENSYIKHKGIFLPQMAEFQKPSFYRHYKDSFSYFELTEDLKNNLDFWTDYCRYLIKQTKKSPSIAAFYSSN